ncbi:putative complex I intermediate-associated protein 30 [Capsicum annuum]|nr:putative complex I intermediate-associated protein 30 [Capsicum annuum]
MLGRKILTRDDFTVLTQRPIPFPKQQKVNLSPGYRASKGDQVLVLLREARVHHHQPKGPRKLQTTVSLWKDFMFNKYCKKEHPKIVMWKNGGGGSQVWKKMLIARDLVEHLIIWQLNQGNSDIWLDNWTGQGDLLSIMEGGQEEQEQYKKVKDLVREGNWDEQLIRTLFTEEIADHVLKKVTPPSEVEKDWPIWSIEPKGLFTVKSAWNYIRNRESIDHIFKRIWVKGLPFKICFFMWKLWRRKVPVDDITRRFGMQGPSKCWCCEEPAVETIQHVFRSSFYANRTWSYFSSFAALFYRNCGENKNISGLRIIDNATRNLRMLLKVRKPELEFSNEWPNIIKEMGNLKMKVKAGKVLWKAPEEGWVKYNTDGAVRGAERGSSYSFCLRDEKGDILFAKGEQQYYANSMQAEAYAVFYAAKHSTTSQHRNSATREDRWAKWSNMHLRGTRKAEQWWGQSTPFYHLFYIYGGGTRDRRVRWSNMHLRGTRKAEHLWGHSIPFYHLFNIYGGRAREFSLCRSGNYNRRQEEGNIPGYYSFKLKTRSILFDQKYILYLIYWRMQLKHKQYRHSESMRYSKDVKEKIINSHLQDDSVLDPQSINILAGNIEDLIPPSERYIFNFSSKDELKNWHLYSDSEYGGLSSAALEIKDTGNGSTSVGFLLLVFASKPPNLGNWLKLNYIVAEVFPTQSKVASWKGVFSGNLSLDVIEGSKWNMTRSGFCGMRSKKFDGFIDLDGYDTIALKLKGDGRCYISTIYTENWVNSPGQDEDNSWQAFVSVPKDNNWYIAKIPLTRYAPTWRGNIINARMEMNPARIVGMSLSVNAEGGVPGAKSGPGDFEVKVDWIKALRMQ